MTNEEARALKRNDFVQVRYGGKGKQRAQVVERYEVTPGAFRVKVRKYRANSGRWTQSTWVLPRDILGVL